MRRLLKPRISPLESFINRASQPVPFGLRPYYLSPCPNNNAATALLNTLSPTDVLHLRLVSKSIHEWTNARLDDLFETLYYTITITQQETGTIVRTPTALAPLRAIGRSCTCFVITILSPNPASLPASTPTPTPTPHSHSASNATSTLPKPASHPQLLTHFLKHLLTHLLPSLHTLTLSLPDPSPWRPQPTTHSTLIHIRQALESLPPTTNLRTLNFNPVSLIHLVSLRWRGLSAYGGEAGWTGSRFWTGVRALDVAVFVPLEVCGRAGGGGPRGRGRARGDDDGGGEREVREGHVRMGLKVLHDWLAGFGRGLELLGFEWVAPAPSEENEEGHGRGPAHPELALQISGPNPLTLHLNPNPFSFTISAPLSAHATSYAPAAQQHQHQQQYQPRHPSLPPSTPTQASALTAPHPSGPYREKRFSAPPIRWESLNEVWLRGVEVGTLASWGAGVRSLKGVYVWEEGEGEEGEGEEEGGRWVLLEGVGGSWGRERKGEGWEDGQGQEGGGQGPGREDVSGDVRYVLEL